MRVFVRWLSVKNVLQPEYTARQNVFCDEVSVDGRNLRSYYSMRGFVMTIRLKQIVGIAALWWNRKNLATLPLMSCLAQSTARVP